MSAPSIRVAYLGPSASFSHQAARNYFGQSANSTLRPIELIPHPSFTSVFAAVQSSSAEAPVYGVVPFENSSNGCVVQLLDLLADRERIYGEVKDCAEYYLRVQHSLLGRRPVLASAGGRDKEAEVVL